MSPADTKTRLERHAHESGIASSDFPSQPRFKELSFIHIIRPLNSPSHLHTDEVKTAFGDFRHHAPNGGSGSSLPEPARSISGHDNEGTLVGQNQLSSSPSNTVQDVKHSATFRLYQEWANLKGEENRMLQDVDVRLADAFGDVTDLSAWMVSAATFEQELQPISARYYPGSEGDNPFYMVLHLREPEGHYGTTTKAYISEWLLRVLVSSRVAQLTCSFCILLFLGVHQQQPGKRIQNYLQRLGFRRLYPLSAVSESQSGADGPAVLSNGSHPMHSAGYQEHADPARQLVGRCDLQISKADFLARSTRYDVHTSDFIISDDMKPETFSNPGSGGVSGPGKEHRRQPLWSEVAASGIRTTPSSRMASSKPSAKPRPEYRKRVEPPSNIGTQLSGALPDSSLQRWFGPVSEVGKALPAAQRDLYRALSRKFIVYKDRRAVSRVFGLGSVIGLSWHENLGSQARSKLKDSQVMSTQRSKGPEFASYFESGEAVNISVRRFVVVNRREGFSVAIPISNYGGKGLTGTMKRAPEAELLAHAIVYALGQRPLRLEGEPNFTKDPICIQLNDPNESFSRSSRLYYAQPHSFAHNTKVKYIGHVISKDMNDVLRCYRREMTRI